MPTSIPKDAISFASVCPKICSELAAALREQNRHDIESQLDKLMIVSRIKGPPSEISFGAFPLQDISHIHVEGGRAIFRDWEEVEIRLRGAIFIFELDNFGLINFLNVKNSPEFYAALKECKIPTDEDLPFHLRKN